MRAAFGRRSVCQDRSGGFTLAQLVVAVAAILILALVVPATTAMMVNRSRVARALAEATRTAAAIRRCAGGDRGWATVVAPVNGPSGAAGAADVLTGLGNSPRERATTRWTAGRSAPLATVIGLCAGAEPGPDPWGNQFVINIGAAAAPAAGGSMSPGAVWVLSAGPNGLIETDYDRPVAAAAVAGDDVAVRVW